MKVFAAFPTALVVFVLSHPIPAGAQEQKLYITAITCPDALYFHTQPKAELHPEGGNPTTVPLAQTSEASYAATIEVQPIRYTLYINDGFCQGGARISILPGYDRHVGLVLAQRNRLLLEFDSSLDATLPIAATRASLLAPNGAEIPLTLDSGAIYGDGLPPNNYTLRIFFLQGLESRIPITLDRGVSVVRLTGADVQKHMGYLIKYFGKPDVFQPLWGKEIR